MKLGAWLESNMCCSRTRSSFRILDTGGRYHLIAEITTKLVGSAQIDLSATKKFRKLSLHSSQIEKAGRRAGLELNQEIDVAIFLNVYTALLCAARKLAFDYLRQRLKNFVHYLAPLIDLNRRESATVGNS
jgi:hypothetical protein